MNLKVKKLHPDAKIPSKGHPGDAGIDFFAVETAVFTPGAQVNVKTGVAVEIPEGHVGLIWDKSSVSFNKGLKVMGGVIDAGYRGEIIISLLNTGKNEQIIEKGQKVAQMIIQKFEDCAIEEIHELSETVRGEGREGSTGNI
ncbi:MAG: dUTP pyrophosphatase [Patescibacteria group bacterium]|jgi:dUTP pyrophosphatase|nr:dUTP pyrophosphatase [Patescibacteria group bacterium]